MKQILMIAMESFARTMEHTKMGSILSPVTAEMDSLEPDVKQISMIAMESFARTMELAKMGSIFSPVTAEMDSLEPDVKQILRIVSLELSVRFLLFYILKNRIEYLM